MRQTTAGPLAAERDVYTIHGVTVTVECDHRAARERIQRNLGPYLVRDRQPEAAAQVAVRIDSGRVVYPVPTHARRVLCYHRLRSYLLGHDHYFTDWYSTLKVSPGGTTITGNLSEETLSVNGLHFFVDILFCLALFEALRFHNLFYLHAAALVGPDGTGYVISGNSGAGKTSTTVSLIHAGFRFLSDDTVFLRLGDGDAVEVLGLARDFHVARDLVEKGSNFDHLSELPDYRFYDGKRRLRPDDWFKDAKASRAVNPEVILFSKVGSEKTSLTPVDAQDAFSRLMPQSVSVMFHPQVAKVHLEALRRVLKHGAAFEVHFSPELKGDAPKIRELVERARDLARERNRS